MRTRCSAYLDLVRLPNLFTAVADVLAGFFFAGGLAGEWPMAMRLCLASACLYAGGVGLNDVCDAARDAIQRPERPIPSRRVSGRTAARLAWVLLALGTFLAATVSTRSVAIATLLCLSIVLYDDVLKGTIIAPGMMGVCRALNLALGMVPGAAVVNADCLYPLVLYWMYVASVTFFARNEADENRPLGLLIGTTGTVSAVVFLAAYIEFRPVRYHAAELLGIVLVGIVAWIGWAAVNSPHPRVVQSAVKRFVILTVVFDACLAWAGGGPVAALIVGLLLVPTVLLGRAFRVT